jgi:hypothetical protein
MLTRAPSIPSSTMGAVNCHTSDVVAEAWSQSWSLHAPGRWGCIPLVAVGSGDAALALVRLVLSGSRSNTMGSHMASLNVSGCEVVLL